ncbi:MAG TPA: MqnA/MqnD/SBP family protein, partial [Chthoniobacterales bacterium]
RFHASHASEYEFRDLAAWWKEITGLPFVFALWLIRPEVENAREIADALRARRDENLRALDHLVAAETEFSPEFCQRYFRDRLRFGFGEREKEGLIKFRETCERHRILRPNAAPLRLV